MYQYLIAIAELLLVTRNARSTVFVEDQRTSTFKECTLYVDNKRYYDEISQTFDYDIIYYTIKIKL